MVLISAFGFAQTGTISGSIIDLITGEGVIGANVVIDGTSTGSSTDVFGKFTIDYLKPGSYNLVVTSISYKVKKLENVMVETGKITNINSTLEEDIAELENIVVSGLRETNNDLSLLNSIRASTHVISGISAEQISKTQDRDAAQVVRRIPGITLIQDRFIIVRGLSSRYNTVMLNGALAPSTESDTRAFSFDIIPSNLLDRVMVYKSGSYENPGEWGGAVIKIFTKNVVDENFTSFNFTTGYRNNTTLNAFKKQNPSSTDFLTFGNGKRGLPQDFPSNLRDLNFQYAKLISHSHNFQNDWQIRNSTAPADLRIRFDMGRKFYLGGIKVNNINSVSYSNTYQHNNIDRFRYTGYNSSGESVPFFSYIDDQYSNNLRLSFLNNWLLQINPNNKIEFRNMYTRIGNTETTIRSGINQNRDVEERNYSLRYQSRGIYSGQVQGTHEFNESQSSLTWVVGVSHTLRNEPDWKRIQSRRIIGSETQFQFVIPNTANVQDASRFYTKVNELAFLNTVDFEHRIDLPGLKDPLKIKTGYFLEKNNRNFSARTIGFIRASSNFDNSILTSPLESIFNKENIRFPDGMIISENTKYTDKYYAVNSTAAGYAGLSLPFAPNFNLSTGARLEFNRQAFTTAPTPSGKPDDVERNTLFLLPSLNLTYNITNKMLIRSAYGRSVNRPQFRELAPFSFYDFDYTVDRVGNTALKSAIIDNIDTRWELYPTPVELISFGVFYKRFENPIETIITTGADNPVFIFSNAKGATAYGTEIEIRKSLKNISSSRFIQNFSLVLNGALIHSQIDLTNSSNLTQASVRPMEGQSPYVINTGLFYQDDNKGFLFNIMYNKYGKRIFLVGDNEFPTIYEMPRDLLDLTISKSIGKKMDLRLGISDLLNAQFLLREDGNHDGKINNLKSDKTIATTRDGQYVTIGFNYKL
jgi:hypothetical protein